MWTTNSRREQKVAHLGLSDIDTDTDTDIEYAYHRLYISLVSVAPTCVTQLYSTSSIRLSMDFQIYEAS